MANEPDDNLPSLRETARTQIETPSTQMQDAVLFKMLTILQKMEENQQKAEKDRGEHENKILGQILTTQNTMLEMMKASHKTEKTRERRREGSSETVTEDTDEITYIPPVEQDSNVSSTGPTISGKTVMVGRRNTNIVNKNIRCNMIVCVLKNSNHSSSVDQSNSLERDLRKAFCDPNNEMVPQLEQMLQAKLDEVHAGSIVLVFLTASRNRFRKLFFQNEQQIRHLIENCDIELLRETKDSEATYNIEIKLDDDNQYSGKDKSGTSVSSTKMGNPQNDKKHSGDEDDNDDDDDDDDNGAISTNTYISGITNENRHKSDICPEVMRKNKVSSNECKRSFDGFLRRNKADNIDEGSSSDNYTSDNSSVRFKEKGVLKNKNRLPLKMSSNEVSLGIPKWKIHGEKSTRQEKFRDDVDDNSDDDNKDNLDGERRSMVPIFPEVSQEDRIETLMLASKDDLQNYYNNLDDKDSKDDEDSREKSTRRQFGTVDPGLISRKDQGMSEADFLHSDRSHHRRKISKGDTRSSRTCAKGKDGRGVQRGACKGCNECFEFKGDARCDYCNCAATQHISLTHELSNLDTTASTSKLGTLQEHKGRDGRGIQRGKCAACTECSEFRGDVRCDYCNCAATQHVNLTHLPTEKNSASTFSREGSENARGKDGRGIQRGKCTGCSECSEFTGDVRCDYCNCAATQHFNLTYPSSDLGASTSVSGTSQSAKGKDGQGIWRGHCTSCTECLEFSGDARCEYCNCAATQHVNITHLSSKKIDSSRFSKGASENAKGKDGKGILRGHCKACTKCLEFRGDVRCEYCNCAAARHVLLKRLPSDTTNPSTRSRGASENAKGKDSQGTWRGHCKGCTECLRFTGGARCEYCNCAAAKHVNLTRLPSEKSDPFSRSAGAPDNETKGKDGRGVKRGKCTGCTECFEFRGDVRCDYCNCAATQHINLTHPSANIDTSRYLPRTFQPGFDSRGVRRGQCTNCNQCNFFTGADRCDYCGCTATEHINFTDPLSNNGFKNSLYDFESKDDVVIKGVLSSLTQNYTLRIGIRSPFKQLGVSQTELSQIFNERIHNKVTQVRKDVFHVFGTILKDIRFENGSIIIKMLVHQLERNADIMLMGRRENIEKYVKSLVKEMLPLQFMNSNWRQQQTLYLDVEMESIFTSTIVLELENPSREPVSIDR